MLMVLAQRIEMILRGPINMVLWGLNLKVYTALIVCQELRASHIQVFTECVSVVVIKTPSRI